MTEAMKNIKASFESLKMDLSIAWNTRNYGIEAGIQEDNWYNKLENGKNYIYGIDPENMAMLKAFFSQTKNGESSLSSIANDAIKMSFDKFMQKHF